MNPALILLSGDDDLLGRSRFKRFRKLATRGALAYGTGGGSEVYRAAQQKRHHKRVTMLGGETPVPLGSIRSLSRKASKVSRKATHAVATTARVANDIRQGNVSSALSRAGSAVSSLGAKSVGGLVSSAGSSVASMSKPWPSWIGYAGLAAGLAAVAGGSVWFLRRKRD